MLCNTIDFLTDGHHTVVQCLPLVIAGRSSHTRTARLVSQLNVNGARLHKECRIDFIAFGTIYHAQCSGIRLTAQFEFAVLNDERVARNACLQVLGDKKRVTVSQPFRGANRTANLVTV